MSPFNSSCNDLVHCSWDLRDLGTTTKQSTMAAVEPVDELKECLRASVKMLLDKLNDRLHEDMDGADFLMQSVITSEIRRDDSTRRQDDSTRRRDDSTRRRDDSTRRQDDSTNWRDEKKTRRHVFVTRRDEHFVQELMAYIQG